jgi:hypothetical protein
MIDRCPPAGRQSIDFGQERSYTERLPNPDKPEKCLK